MLLASIPAVDDPDSDCYGSEQRRAEALLLTALPGDAALRQECVSLTRSDSEVCPGGLSKFWRPGCRRVSYCVSDLGPTVHEMAGFFGPAQPGRQRRHRRSRYREGGRASHDLSRPARGPACAIPAEGTGG